MIEDKKHILRELLYSEIKDNFTHIKICIEGSDNSDMLEEREIKIFENIVTDIINKYVELCIPSWYRSDYDKK